MKKTIWALLGAAVLLGTLLFFLLRENAPNGQANPLLPPVQPVPSSVRSANHNLAAESGAAIPEDSDSLEPTDAEPHSVPVTEPELPVDWNSASSETEPNPEGRPQASEQPEAPILPQQTVHPSDGASPSQTETGKEKESTEKPDGQIVIPILPPDIFSKEVRP